LNGRQIKKETVVLASGVFDLLHLGHVKFLEAAKRNRRRKRRASCYYCKEIAQLKKTKGKKPIMSEDQRCALVESLKVVDRAVLGYESLDIGEVIESNKTRT